MISKTVHNDNRMWCRSRCVARTAILVSTTKGLGLSAGVRELARSCRPRSFEHLVGGREERLGHGKTERLGGLEVDGERYWSVACTGRSPGFEPLRMRFDGSGCSSVFVGQRGANLGREVQDGFCFAGTGDRRAIARGPQPGVNPGVGDWGLGAGGRAAHVATIAAGPGRYGYHPRHDVKPRSRPHRSKLQ
jgi:hypothetical protein